MKPAQPRTGRQRWPLHPRRRRGRIRLVLSAATALIFLLNSHHGLAMDAGKNVIGIQQSEDADVCTASASSTSADGQSLRTEDETTPMIFLQSMSTKELNVQATNYILSLLEHHIPKAAESLNEHLDEMPLVLTLAIIVCIIVTRVVFVGILLGIIAGFVCAVPMAFVGRYFYRPHAIACIEKCDIDNSPSGTAVDANDTTGTRSTGTTGDENGNESDESIPTATNKKTLRFAPGTKRADVAGKSNMRRRRLRKKKNTSSSSGDDGGNANNMGNAEEAKQQVKVKTY